MECCSVCHSYLQYGYYLHYDLELTYILPYHLSPAPSHSHQCSISQYDHFISNLLSWYDSSSSYTLKPFNNTYDNRSKQTHALTNNKSLHTVLSHEMNQLPTHFAQQNVFAQLLSLPLRLDYLLCCRKLMKSLKSTTASNTTSIANNTTFCQNLLSVSLQHLQHFIPYLQITHSLSIYQQFNLKLNQLWINSIMNGIESQFSRQLSLKHNARLYNVIYKDPLTIVQSTMTLLLQYFNMFALQTSSQNFHHQPPSEFQYGFHPHHQQLYSNSYYIHNKINQTPQKSSVFPHYILTNITNISQKIYHPLFSPPSPTESRQLMSVLLMIFPPNVVMIQCIFCKKRFMTNSQLFGHLYGAVTSPKQQKCCPQPVDIDVVQYLTSLYQHTHIITQISNISETQKLNNNNNNNDLNVLASLPKFQIFFLVLSLVNTTTVITTYTILSLLCHNYQYYAHIMSTTPKTLRDRVELLNPLESPIGQHFYENFNLFCSEFIHHISFKYQNNVTHISSNDIFISMLSTITEFTASLLYNYEYLLFFRLFYPWFFALSPHQTTSVNSTHSTQHFNATTGKSSLSTRLQNIFNQNPSLYHTTIITPFLKNNTYHCAVKARHKPPFSQNNQHTTSFLTYLLSEMTQYYQHTMKNSYYKSQISNFCSLQTNLPITPPNQQIPFFHPTLSKIQQNNTNNIINIMNSNESIPLQDILINLPPLVDYLVDLCNNTSKVGESDNHHLSDTNLAIVTPYSLLQGLLMVDNPFIGSNGQNDEFDDEITYTSTISLIEHIYAQLSILSYHTLTFNLCNQSSATYETSENQSSLNNELLDPKTDLNEIDTTILHVASPEFLDMLTNEQSTTEDYINPVTFNASFYTQFLSLPDDIDQSTTNMISELNFKSTLPPPLSIVPNSRQSLQITNGDVDILPHIPHNYYNISASPSSFSTGIAPLQTDIITISSNFDYSFLMQFYHYLCSKNRLFVTNSQQSFPFSQFDPQQQNSPISNSHPALLSTTTSLSDEKGRDFSAKIQQITSPIILVRQFLPQSVPFTISSTSTQKVTTSSSYHSTFTTRHEYTGSNIASNLSTILNITISDIIGSNNLNLSQILLNNVYDSYPISFGGSLNQDNLPVSHLNTSDTQLNANTLEKKSIYNSLLNRTHPIFTKHNIFAFVPISVHDDHVNSSGKYEDGNIDMILSDSNQHTFNHDDGSPDEKYFEHQFTQDKAYLKSLLSPILPTATDLSQAPYLDNQHSDIHVQSSTNCYTSVIDEDHHRKRFLQNLEGQQHLIQDFLFQYKTHISSDSDDDTNLIQNDQVHPTGDGSTDGEGTKQDRFNVLNQLFSQMYCELPADYSDNIDKTASTEFIINSYDDSGDFF